MNAAVPKEPCFLEKIEKIRFIVKVLYRANGLTGTDTFRYTLTMPITKQAEKKLRHDKKVTKHNATKKKNLRAVVKTMRAKPTEKQLQSVFSVLDKAVKTHLIHKNKAMRLKSRLSHLLKK